MQPIKGRGATLWRTAAHKTKRHVCNLVQCLLTGPCSSIPATAGGKGAGRKRSGATNQGHFIITLHQPTTLSDPIASSTRCYKCQQCPPRSVAMPIYWESTPWDLIDVPVLRCPLSCYPREQKAIHSAALWASVMEDHSFCGETGVLVETITATTSQCRLFDAAKRITFKKNN